MKRNKLIISYFGLLFFLSISTSSAQENTYDQLVFECYNILFANQPEKPDSVIFYNNDGQREGKIDFLFNTNGKMLSNISYYWGHYQWEPDLKEEILYDPENEPLSAVYSMFSSENQCWEINYQANIEPLYFEDRKYALEYQIHGSEYKTRHIYYYDENERISNLAYFSQPTDQEKWTQVGNYQFEYQLNDRWKGVYNLSFKNGKTSGNRMIITTDDWGNISSEESYWLKKIDKKNNYVWEHEKCGHATYFYSNSPTSIQYVPSHFQAKVWIEGRMLHVESDTPVASVSVYHIGGTLVYTNTGNSTIYSLFDSRFPLGIYIVHLKNVEGKTQTTKLLVK